MQANENQNSVSQNIRIHDHPYSINCGYLLFFETTLGRVSQGVNWSWSQCIKSHHAQESSGKGYQATSETETSSEASYLG